MTGMTKDERPAGDRGSRAAERGAGQGRAGNRHPTAGSGVRRAPGDLSAPGSSRLPRAGMAGIRGVWGDGTEKKAAGAAAGPAEAACPPQGHRGMRSPPPEATGAVKSPVGSPAEAAGSSDIPLICLSCLCLFDVSQISLSCASLSRNLRSPLINR